MTRRDVTGAGPAPTRVRLPAAVRQRLVELARGEYPHEACGVLLGTVVDDVVIITTVTQAANLAVERAADRYLLDPDDLLRAHLRADDEGLEVVGIWHSHPDHPPVPSVTDRDGAWCGWSYLIAAVDRTGVTAIRSWRLISRTFHEEAMIP